MKDDKMSDRTIVIGDLHGCHGEAVALLKKLNVTAADRVIFLGDLIDRGPDNAKCVDLVRHREQVQGSIACILGNHEEKHLFYRDIEHRKGKVEVQVATHVATRMQLTREHYEYFEQMPLYLRLPEHNAVCVHAGVFPGRKIEEQTPRHLLHIQMINPFKFDQWGRVTIDEKSMWPSKCHGAPEWKFWTHFWDGPERIIFGHSVLDRPLMTDKVAGIDGGAVFGHQLHALVLPEWKIVTVKGQQDYGKGRRGASVTGIGSFLVHGDVSTYS